MTLPLVLDCDPGTDDALALFLALASPELHVLAITVAGGNAGLDHTLPNALALRSLTGSDIPVYAGADRPLLGSFTNAARVHGIDGLGGIALPSGKPAEAEHAADAIRRIVRSAKEPVTLVGIAPVTNLALALMTEPSIAANMDQIVLMSGAWGEGNATPAAEFNAVSDPEALAVVLGSGRPIVMATLEVAAQALCMPQHLAAMRASGSGRCLRAACDILGSMPFSRRLGGAGAALYDPCAIAWLIRPDLFTIQPASVTMDLGPGPCRGRTVIDRWGRSRARPNALVLETIDAEGFFALLTERFNRLP
jgi:inosine-uridine nucleoside N-ribohydrolase